VRRRLFIGPSVALSLALPLACIDVNVIQSSPGAGGSGGMDAASDLDVGSGGAAGFPQSSVGGTATSCLAAGNCVHGFCADGVCCNVACQGACVACNLPGRVGICWPVDSGRPDPHGVCMDQGSPSCGHNGTCDGVGGCANYAQGVQCSAPSCAGNSLNPGGTCDGIGTCKLPSGLDCDPFRCVDGACAPSCLTDDDCAAGVSCVNNSCGPKLLGQSCANGDECASNFCVDGVCCGSPCPGPCESCALQSAPGLCMTVPPGTIDPRGFCKDQGAASCGTNGECDRSGGCASYPQGTFCGNQTCSSGIYTPPSTCDASSHCVASATSSSCAPYLCNGSIACGAYCVLEDDCSPGYGCVFLGNIGFYATCQKICSNNGDCPSRNCLLTAGSGYCVM
jgi:hypothetical protein